MASCSSSSASFQTPQRYDVFISFRGEDTRPNFTSHLVAALRGNKIETYIDDRLEKGDEVWPSLVKAIEDSTLFLVVFSENYASSTWCLNELTKILECSKDQGKGHPVLPVFYKIEPTHVRKQTGSYEKAFTKHEQSKHNQQVHKWRAALNQAANLSGWDSGAFRNEAELIGKIVKDVLMKVDSMEQSVSLDGLVGIHEPIAHVESLMCNELQDVRFIGIWGMGGIGKTTIAKALFDKLCSAFDSFCFLANVREELEKYGIVHLRKELHSALLEDEGSIYAWKRLRRRKVLVVLDDVNDSEQLKSLAGAHNWFGHGSRVIVTARDKQVFGRNVDNIYEVKALDFDVALQLFKLNAFKDYCFDKEFERLSRKVVDYAKGNPLALVVLSSLLYKKNKEEWESQLEKLKQMPCKKVQQILKFSYDELDRQEKEIFLYIACFLKERPVEGVKVLLDACGYQTSIGLKRLQDKALLSITKGVVTMHDLIQEMGREIVREESFDDPGKRSRLWHANDIYQVLKDNKGSKAIKSITLDLSKIEGLNLSPQVFGKMQRLRFLEIYNSNPGEHSLYLPQGLEFLSNELVYIRWDNYPLKSLPLTFSAEKLVSLNMKNSRIRKLWHGAQNVVNLKAINLRDCIHLMEFPDFSKAINLEVMDLSHCVSLCKVHPSVFSLAKLEELVLTHCVALTNLKSDIQLRSLSFLALDGCSNLKEFSITSENMITLDLEGTAVNELPSSVGRMFKLEYLNLRYCESLKNIGSNLFYGLQSLKELCLHGWRTLEVVDLSKLSSLSILSIEKGDIECLPASMKHLPRLWRLTLNKCKRLRSLPQLPPSLKELSAMDCSSLETVQFTSFALQPLNKRVVVTDCRNCLKLNQHSIKAILANYLVQLDKCLPRTEDDPHSYQYLENHTEIIYPGSRVPEWFKYRTTHDSITIDLSSAPLSMDWTSLFCVIVPWDLSAEDICIDCHGAMRIMNDERVDKSDDYAEDDIKMDFDLELYSLGAPDKIEDGSNLISDHVCLWGHDILCGTIHDGIKRSRASSNPKISLELNFDCYFISREWSNQKVEIKGCGVCPTYASEYQNFIKELNMESEASTSSQNNDEQETVPPKQKSMDLIFPPLPTATWKNGTKGLKDIIHL